MAKLGTALSIKFASGFLAEILDCSPPDASRESIDTTHMGTEDEYTNTPADLVKWGEMNVEIAFDPGVVPPIDQDPEEIIITFRDGETWTFDGYMTGYAPASPLEARMTATCRIQVTGGVAQGDDSSGV